MKQIQVNKTDYEIFKFNGGHFGITKIGTFGGELVFGGDSANEDDHDEEYFQDVYDNWDGVLHLQPSNRYGDENEYRIEV